MRSYEQNVLRVSTVIPLNKRLRKGAIKNVPPTDTSNIEHTTQKEDKQNRKHTAENYKDGYHHKT